ncbi:MAG: Germination protease [Caldanaerobacter subterraneus]|uniref:Germination protease n=2 Tax=Thermoanaerobacter TaxID=1754 RepID=B0KA90_THEP3|nr:MULTISPECIES: GPR endopeptidase [Thermoanaerobacter]KUJ90750.1 MAG: spore protease [Thermoanaerobacter thermocopriae]KUK34298.1 MAG: Germination protease [Caldanaerobacter subterraneus]ABY93360.1 spore protease [Thermoanaerobacter sp. X514]ABY95053.1 spore protease [Thermoanaerobacter pseudethanolicus ATCC 33223]ADV80005.1 spore protease [Thermoanaerobacter brockii subsp. finnii Ako-1]
MYSIRTDLAVEARELYKGREIPGVRVDEKHLEGIKVTKVKILNEEGEKAMGKPVGDYITIEAPGLIERDLDLEEEVAKVLADIIKEIANLTENTQVLVVGLGNWNVTPDALGPRVVSNIVVTRHLKEYAPQQFGDEIRSVSAISPGVLGITGIETAEILKGVVDRIKPDLIITIDALASRRLERLSTTIQISNTGISPGSGIGNRRLSITEQSLGIPVIAIGVPTVVDAVTIANDTIEYLTEELLKHTKEESPFYEVLKNMSQQEKYSLIQEVLTPYVHNLVVTPKEIDLLVRNIASIISRGINLALQPGLTEREMNQLLH